MPRPRTGREATHVRWAWLGAIALVFGGPVACSGDGEYLEDFADRFAPRLDEFSAKPGLVCKGAPRIKGEVVFLEEAFAKKNELAFSNWNVVPWEDSPLVVAEQTDDVRTVIWMQDESVKVGEYWNGDAARRHDIRVTIIDLKRACAFPDQILQGLPPPSVKTEDEPGVGEPPDAHRYLECVALQKETCDYVVVREADGPS